VKIIRKNSVKIRLISRIIFNALLIVLQVYMIFNISLAWFFDNKAVEMSRMDIHVYNSRVPIFISASFNNAGFSDYSDESYTLTKTIIPGDIINLSVFADLTEISAAEFIEITVMNMPDWLTYIKGSAKATYADRRVTLSGDAYIELERHDYGLCEIPECFCKAEIPHPVEENGEIIFKIKLPDDYFRYDGICLDFQIFFEDDLTNQNDYMNAVVQLRFIASEI